MMIYSIYTKFIFKKHKKRSSTRVLNKTKSNPFPLVGKNGAIIAQKIENPVTAQDRQSGNHWTLHCRTAQLGYPCPICACAIWRHVDISMMLTTIKSPCKRLIVELGRLRGHHCVLASFHQQSRHVHRNCARRNAIARG